MRGDGIFGEKMKNRVEAARVKTGRDPQSGKKISTDQTKIKVFKKAKDAEKYINKMQGDGYTLVDLTDGKKHYSITKGVGASILLGPLGLIAGRGKNRITVTMTKADK